jgi:hypothetical protein
MHFLQLITWSIGQNPIYLIIHIVNFSIFAFLVNITDILVKVLKMAVKQTAVYSTLENKRKNKAGLSATSPE